MIYASVAVSIGVSIFLISTHIESKVIALIGLAFYVFGMIAGSVSENRLEKRIKELEDKLKEA